MGEPWRPPRKRGFESDYVQKLAGAEWLDEVDLEAYRTALSPSGGRIALVPRRSGDVAKPNLLLLSDAGDQVASMVWYEPSPLVSMHWAPGDCLVCVMSDGRLFLYDERSAAPRRTRSVIGGDTDSVAGDRVAMAASWGTGLVVLTRARQAFAVVRFSPLEVRRLGDLAAALVACDEAPAALACFARHPQGATVPPILVAVPRDEAYRRAKVVETGGGGEEGDARSDSPSREQGGGEQAEQAGQGGEGEGEKAASRPGASSPKSKRRPKDDHARVHTLRAIRSLATGTRRATSVLPARLQGAGEKPGEQALAAVAEEGEGTEGAASDPESDAAGSLAAGPPTPRASRLDCPVLVATGVDVQEVAVPLAGAPVEVVASPSGAFVAWVTHAGELCVTDGALRNVLMRVALHASPPEEVLWYGEQPCVALLWHRAPWGSGDGGSTLSGRVLLVEVPTGASRVLAVDLPLLAAPEPEGLRLVCPTGIMVVQPTPSALRRALAWGSLDAAAQAIDAAQPVARMRALALQRQRARARQHSSSGGGGGQAGEPSAEERALAEKAAEAEGAAYSALRSFERLAQKGAAAAGTQCLVRAATQVDNAADQHALLRAAHVSRQFCSPAHQAALADEIARAASELRVVAALGTREAGMHLTCAQLRRLGLNTVVSRLLARHQFPLALRLATEGGVGPTPVLLAWLEAKLGARPDAPDEELLHACQRLGSVREGPNAGAPLEGLSFAALASAAFRAGRTSLGVALARRHPRRRERVVALLAASQWGPALDEAEEDPEIAHLALRRLEKGAVGDREVEDLLATRPLAANLYVSKHMAGNRRKAYRLLIRTNRLVEAASCFLRDVRDARQRGSEEGDVDDQLRALSSAAELLRDAPDESGKSLAALCEDEMLLLRVQKDHSERLVGLPAAATIGNCLARRHGEAERIAERLRDRLGVSKSRYALIRADALAQAGDLAALAKMQGGRNSVGPAELARACTRHGHMREALRYIAAVEDPAVEARLLAGVGRWGQALQAAKKSGDPLLPVMISQWQEQAGAAAEGPGVVGGIEGLDSGLDLRVPRLDQDETARRPQESPPRSPPRRDSVSSARGTAGSSGTSGSSMGGMFRQLWRR